MKKVFTLIISVILICCCALGFVGCNKGKNGVPSPVKYTVKFDLNGGSGPIDEQKVEEGGKVKKPAQPTRSGYDFDGWYTQADGGRIWNFYLDTVNQPTVIYAHWSVQIFDAKGLAYRAIEENGSIVAYSLKGIGRATDAELNVPSEFGGLPVTGIDDYAFYENGNITNVTIGGSVTAIGDSAFYNCGNLKSLTINGEITHMGDLAFAHCLALESVQIGSKVEEISYYAFFECAAIKEVTVPSSVKSIGESAFAFCTSLERVNFNEGLEYIGDCAFGGCAALEEFVMPQSVTGIGLGILMFVGGLTFVGEETINNKISKIVMPDGITEITQFAFAGCAISDISIGQGVKKIDYSSFYRCGNLESVVIPVSVKSIVSYAFYRCSLLNTVYYEGTAEEWAKVYVSKNGNDILKAQVYYYSQSTPQEEGNFWHYDGDGVTPVKW